MTVIYILRKILLHPISAWSLLTRYHPNQMMNHTAPSVHLHQQLAIDYYGEITAPIENRVRQNRLSEHLVHIPIAHLLGHSPANHAISQTQTLTQIVGL